MRGKGTAFLPPLTVSHSTAVGSGNSLRLDLVVFGSLCTSPHLVRDVRDFDVRLSNLVKDVRLSCAWRCGDRGRT